MTQETPLERMVREMKLPLYRGIGSECRMVYEADGRRLAETDSPGIGSLIVDVINQLAATLKAAPAPVLSEEELRAAIVTAATTMEAVAGDLLEWPNGSMDVNSAAWLRRDAARLRALRTERTPSEGG